METPQAARFGELLRQYRGRAGLTQEALAEAAGLSVRGLSDLERGVNKQPRAATLHLLIVALGLAPSESAALHTSAQGAAPATVMMDLPTRGEGLQRPGGATPDGGATAAPAPPPSASATPSALPTGTLTFLLTDIAGSTSLWEQHPAAMQAAIARHDALVEEVLARHGGRQVKERGEGDSIFAVFVSPSAALTAACALQAALQAEPWPPQTPIRVRVGLHTGEAELRGIGYYGVTVNRTARIRSLGHGGQVLLSQATTALVRGSLPDGATLRALGAHQLKGLVEPEEIYLVVQPGLGAEFPPLAAPSAPPTNLPAALTSFIGRERERGEVRTLLGEARLVTLTGAGGAGKTRLALAVAGEVLAEYADGVWLTELAPLADPTLVAHMVAQALGVREEPHRPLLATLIERLKDRHLLLVLDNCEHLVAACASLSVALLRACPRLRILATSREGLGVAGERLYRVPSLSVPDLDHLPPPEQLGAYAAVTLFLTRARERRAHVDLTVQNARPVAQICVRLDGMPLALELAAARVASLPVAAIAARLDDRFRLLTGGPRTAVSRQQTLRATLDWSYDLLTEGERRLLDRLAVFASGCTLEAAEAVCAGEGIEPWEVMDLLGSLVSKSLVPLGEAGPGEEQDRYQLLETVRQYGWERLSASGEAAAVRDRHLAWCVALAEEACPHLTEADQGHWLDLLEREHDNLRAALGWSSREAGDAALGQRLAGALWRFWWTRGHAGEGRGWLEAALAGDGQGSPAARALALHGAGALAWAQGEYGRAESLHEEALALRRALDDTAGIAHSLNALAHVVIDQGQIKRAAALFEEALALWRVVGDRRGIDTALGNLGMVAGELGEYERAAALQEEALVGARAREDTWDIAMKLDDLGWVVYQQGVYGRARALVEEALSLQRRLGPSWTTAWSLIVLGFVARMQGDDPQATALFEESLALSRRMGLRNLNATSLRGLGRVAQARGENGRAMSLQREGIRLSHGSGAARYVVLGLEELAWTTAACGRHDRAALLGGAAEAIRAELGMLLPGDQRAGHAEAVEAMRAALGEEAFAAAWAEGRALSREQAVAEALHEAEARAGSLPDGTSASIRLSMGAPKR